MNAPVGTMSQYRVWARSAVTRIIEDYVVGPVTSLPREDVLQLRKVLREKYPPKGLSSWEKKIIREEFRAALGYPYPRQPKMRRRYQMTETDIMPAMRDWARKQGILKSETASAP